MTEQLRDILHELGDEQPAVRVDPGTYAAGRRAHRRGVATRGGLAAAVVAAVVLAVPPVLDSDTPEPASGKPVPALPAVLHEVPSRLAGHQEDGYEWHERVAAGTLEVGPTAVVLPVNGGAVVAVSALDGVYQGLELPGFDEDSYFRFDGSPVALAPDGTRLAYTWNPDVIDGDTLEPSPETGIRIADLLTGEVTSHQIESEFGVYAQAFGWSPDGRYLSYALQIVTDAGGGVRGSRNYVVERLDTRTGERVRTPLQATETDTAVNDAGEVAVAGGGYNGVWTPGQGVSRFDGDFAGAAWAPHGRRFALGSWHGGLAVADRDGIRREVSGPGIGDGMDAVRTRVLGWPDARTIVVLDLADQSVQVRSVDLEDVRRLIDAEGVAELDQMSVATGLLEVTPRDYPAPDWPTDWTSPRLWLGLSALVLVPLLLLGRVVRRRTGS